ncbi:MAG: hypothetical protein KDC73_09510 [Ignavibacteriae bacterium]|nr:hypothetical protein [Ignavibacteriota bacterium]MCB9242053.1 hypothetical protein [Ignavibacteriales bacterium]
MNIQSITLKTDDLTKLYDFYSIVLEMEITHSDTNAFSVKAGSTLLTFENDTASSEAFYHFAFNIPENQLDDSIEWLKGKANLITLDGQSIFDFKAWNAHSIYFYDPVGNIIEFIARHGLDNASNEKFSGRSICSVSEIGMPVQNVKEFYDKLYNELSLPLFTGDLKTFTATGDDKGLFIIVPEERRWFPNCPLAEIFPISVEIEGILNKEILFREYGYRIISMEI